MTKALIICSGLVTLPWRLFLELIRWPNVMFLYKSGHRVKIYLSSIEVTKFTDSNFSVEWESVGPKPLLLNPNEIEAIFWLR